MIDKLDVGIPRTAPYTRSFAKLLSISESPEWRDKVWREGGHFRKRGDLREVSGGELPVIIHIGNLHNPKADDKVELIETGKYRMNEMKETIREMYVFPPDESRIMRVDLAADIEGTSVEWFRQHTHVALKQTQRAWVQCELSQRRAQTLLAGQKPRQIRIYDKTGHRVYLLAQELRRMTRSEREIALTFEERWGYEESRVITRVERQMGGGEPKRRGYERVGNLYSLSFVDPFESILFPSDLPAGPMDFRDPRDAYTAEALRAQAKRDGVPNTRDALRRRCVSDWQFYKLWKRYKVPILQGGEDGTTREAVMLSFRASLERQLAA